MNGLEFPAHGKVLFSATLVRGHIAKFHIPYLKWFKEQGWETWVAAKNDYPDGVCEIPYCDHFVNIDFARSPFSKQTFVAYHQLKGLFAKERFDIVHTHTPVGGVLTRIAAREARSMGTKVIYTAHGFHFYEGAPFANWLLWYPVERAMTRFTDVLITINDEDFNRAKKFAKCRVEYVPGVGIDLEKFKVNKNRDKLRRELGVSEFDKVVLAVGDLTINKNHQCIIRSFLDLDESFGLLICGTGVERESLLALVSELGLDSRVRLLGFRRDIPALMHAPDMLVFPSIHEGLPVAVMEAMASGLPVIATSIRGIVPDLLENGVNGLVLEDDQPKTIARSIRELASDIGKTERLAAKAQIDSRRFAVDRIVSSVGSIYAKALM